MNNLFLVILDMSFVGAFVIAVILIARIPLKRAPKILSYCLWSVAGFRLVVPFSLESIFSLIPFNSAPIQSNMAAQTMPRTGSDFAIVDYISAETLTTASSYYSADPMQTWVTVGAYIWLIGMIVLVLYGLVSYIMLHHKVRHAKCIESNIYEADNIESPFVLGVLKAKIYLPSDLTANEREYIILHEQTHIKRRDHIVKFIAYFILCLHWFNPLAWVAFVLMGVDMELSCDERVLKEIGNDAKKDYSRSLLKLSTNNSIIKSSPLAFSENGLKTRIKNVLKLKKHSRVIVITAVVLTLALGIGLVLNGVRENNEDYIPESYQPGDDHVNDINNQESASAGANENSDVHAVPDSAQETAPVETAPTYIFANNRRIDITETEVTLNVFSVTDADLEKLQNMTNLQTLRIGPGHFPYPAYAFNSGIINMDLIAELTDITTLIIWCRGVTGLRISDLSPLVNLSNLEVFLLEDNYISDISALESMKSLTRLHLWTPQVSDISPLAHLTNLEVLDLHVQADDISMLSELSNLTNFSLTSTQIDDISVLANLTSLTDLSIGEVQVSDFSIISGLTNLNSLTLLNAQIDDFSYMSELPNLKYLRIFDSQVTDFSTLSNLTDLTGLLVVHSRFSDISPLENLTNLTSLDISGNSISDISALTELSNLTFLNIRDNSISDISALAELSNLNFLELSGNLVSDLSPIENLSNLKDIRIVCNPIEDLTPLAELTGLEFIWLPDWVTHRQRNELQAELPDTAILHRVEHW